MRIQARNGSHKPGPGHDLSDPAKVSTFCNFATFGDSGRSPPDSETAMLLYMLNSSRSLSKPVLNYASCSQTARNAFNLDPSSDAAKVRSRRRVASGSVTLMTALDQGASSLATNGRRASRGSEKWQLFARRAGAVEPLLG